MARDKARTKTRLPKEKTSSEAASFRDFNLSTHLSTTGLEDDVISECSDACSEKTCSDCCTEDDCADICAKSCDGFVDCDDSNACTKAECGEEVCRDVAPPCFDSKCVEEIDSSDIAVALHSLAAHNPLQQFQDSCLDEFFPSLWDQSSYDPSSIPVHGETRSPQFAQSSGQHVLQYPSPVSIQQASNAPPSPSLDATRPSSKRRKLGHDVAFQSAGAGASGSSNATRPGASSAVDEYAAFGTPLTDHYSSQSTNTQSSHLELDHDGNLIQCHWGDECNQEFYDLGDLNSHVFRTHVNPQNEIHCKWDHCDQSTIPEAISSHVNQSHKLGEDELVCLWANCCARFKTAEELDSHLKTVHAQEIYCQWDHCGTRANDPADLSSHLQVDHCIDPQLMSMQKGHPFTPSSGIVQSPNTEIKVCRWIDHGAEGAKIETTCGKTFKTAEELHLHVRIAHQSSMTAKSGYRCNWEDCSRDGGSFPQKSKLDRHLQVHTGCKSPPSVNYFG
ncbi:MAG: pumilio domain member 6 [Chaenotheca gracillima]|nr:MAG: pumilio domain member 6 [Chaenotheca gracillima]